MREFISHQLGENDDSEVLEANATPLAAEAIFGMFDQPEDNGKFVLDKSQARITDKPEMARVEDWIVYKGEVGPVAKVDERYATVESAVRQGIISGFHAPHGQYTIVTPAEEPEVFHTPFDRVNEDARVDPEIAHVGDIVVDKDGNPFEVEWIRDSDGVVGGCQAVIRNAKHGEYRVAHRAEDLKKKLHITRAEQHSSDESDPKSWSVNIEASLNPSIAQNRACMACGQQEANVAYHSGVRLCQQCINKEASFTTAELVEMLSQRTGVQAYEIPDPEHVWQVRWMDTRDDTVSKNWTMVGPSAGPARILVVMD